MAPPHYSYDIAGCLALEGHRLQGRALDQSITRPYDNDGLLASQSSEDGAGKLISSATYAKAPQGRTTQSAVTYGKVDAAGGAGRRKNQRLHLRPRLSRRGAAQQPHLPRRQPRNAVRASTVDRFFPGSHSQE